MAKWTTALDDKGKLISIEDAKRHGFYTCRNCRERMVAKMGDKLAHHFSHFIASKVCNHDLWLRRNILDVLVERISRSDPFMVSFPHGDVDLHGCHFRRETMFLNWTPDLLVRIGKDNVFIQVCISSHCNNYLISSGFRIVEIHVSETRALEELSSEDIRKSGRFYSLLYYNFESREEEKVEPHSQSATIMFTGRHACYFVVHEDHTYELKKTLEYIPSDLLVLGIDTFDDFAVNIGKAYAFKKRGVLSESLLSDYEKHIDISAVAGYFHVQELHTSQV